MYLCEVARRSVLLTYGRAISGTGGREFLEAIPDNETELVDVLPANLWQVTSKTLSPGG
jgi:hypothetical protein